MKKILSTVAFVTLAFASAAHAHGPTRGKISESIEISAAPDAVWAIVGDYAHPEKWVAPVESTTATGGTEPGAIRELKLKGGGTLKEELKTYDASAKKMQYKLEDPTDPAVFPVNNYSATLVVSPSGGGSKVEWNAAFYRWFLNNNPPEGQNEAAAEAAVKKVITESLANLKKVAEGH